MCRNFLLFLLLSLTLIACAPTTKSSKPTAEAVPQLTLDLAALPGASMSVEAPPVISYPEQALFGPGAVMLLVGSQAILDPLASMLKSQPEWRWEATVRAVSAYGGDYDQDLAEGRAQLLEKYLTYRGVPPGTLSFRALAAEGTPFELRPLAAQDLSPDNSSAVKE